MLFREDLYRDDIGVPADLGVPKTGNMLCLNESPLNLFDTIASEVNQRLSQVPLNRYFNPVTGDLKRRLAEYVNLSAAGAGAGPAAGSLITEQHLLIGNGADEMLYFTFLAVRRQPGDFAAAIAPSYFDYKTYCEAVGLGLKTVLLDKENFSFEPGQLLELSRQPGCRLIILCNPNNPTGNLFEPERLLEVVGGTDLPVLVDETYFEFSSATLLAELENYPNLILVRSFSKAFAAAGLRFGYLISRPGNIKIIRAVTTVFNCSLAIQAFVMAILDRRELFAGHLAEVLKHKQQLFDNLNAVSGIIAHPSATNFLLFKVSGGKSAVDLYQYLAKQDFSLRNVSALPHLAGHLRVTVGTEMQNRQLIDLINKFIEGR